MSDPSDRLGTATASFPDDDGYEHVRLDAESYDDSLRLDELRTADDYNRFEENQLDLDSEQLDAAYEAMDEHELEATIDAASDEDLGFETLDDDGWEALGDNERAPYEEEGEGL